MAKPKGISSSDEGDVDSTPSPPPGDRSSNRQIQQIPGATRGTYTRLLPSTSGGREGNFQTISGIPKQATDVNPPAINAFVKLRASETSGFLKQSKSTQEISRFSKNPETPEQHYAVERSRHGPHVPLSGKKCQNTQKCIPEQVGRENPHERRAVTKPPFKKDPPESNSENAFGCRQSRAPEQIKASQENARPFNQYNAAGQPNIQERVPLGCGKGKHPRTTTKSPSRPITTAFKKLAIADNAIKPAATTENLEPKSTEYARTSQSFKPGDRTEFSQRIGSASRLRPVTGLFEAGPGVPGASKVATIKGKLLCNPGSTMRSLNHDKKEQGYPRCEGPVQSRGDVNALEHPSQQRERQERTHRPGGSPSFSGGAGILYPNIPGRYGNASRPGLPPRFVSGSLPRAPIAAPRFAYTCNGGPGCPYRLFGRQTLPCRASGASNGARGIFSPVGGQGLPCTSIGGPGIPHRPFVGPRAPQQNITGRRQSLVCGVGLMPSPTFTNRGGPAMLNTYVHVNRIPLVPVYGNDGGFPPVRIGERGGVLNRYGGRGLRHGFPREREQERHY